MPTMHPSAAPLVSDRIPSQESPLSPEWTHAITTLMGHPLSSEPGKHIKKWILYHGIHKYTNFALRWDPIQFKHDMHLQTYQEFDGSVAYLKCHTVRKLIDLRKYMSLLIRQERPHAQKHNLLYFISGSQLFKLTAHDMKSALVNEKLENQRSYTSPSSPAPMRSTILWELASIKKSTREGAWQAFTTQRDEHLFVYFQRDLFTIDKSHNVSEILDPTFTPGLSQKENELFEAKQTFMLKVFRETLLKDMGRNKVRMHHRTTDAQAVWKEYLEYMTSPSKKWITLDDPPQDVYKSHLSDPTSNTTILNETCPLDTSCDHLLYLDSPSLSSELQDNSSVASVEIDLLPEFERQLDHANLSPTDAFSGHHDYELF